MNMLSVMLGTVNIAMVGSWWLQALSNPSSVNCFFIAMACVFALALCTRAGLRRRIKSDLSRRQGTATIEFALVAPIGVFFTLLLAQTTFVMAGNVIVHYAAFSATRSAIVQIPFDGILEGEPSNSITCARGKPKFEAIRQAAVFCLIPVAGRSEEGNIPSTAFVSGLEAYFAKYGRRTPNWVGSQMAWRYRYADLNTEVRLMRTTVQSPTQMSFEPLVGTHRFGPVEPITVHVAHRFNLALPYVSWIFADGRHTSHFWGTGRFTEIEAQYTLTNEGISRALPPLPSVPRIDPPIDDRKTVSTRG